MSIITFAILGLPAVLTYSHTEGRFDWNIAMVAMASHLWRPREGVVPRFGYQVALECEEVRADVLEAICEWSKGS